MRIFSPVHVELWITLRCSLLARFGTKEFTSHYFPALLEECFLSSATSSEEIRNEACSIASRLDLLSLLWELPILHTPLDLVTLSEDQPFPAAQECIQILPDLLSSSKPPGVEYSPVLHLLMPSWTAASTLPGFPDQAGVDLISLQDFDHQQVLFIIKPPLSTTLEPTVVLLDKNQYHLSLEVFPGAGLEEMPDNLFHFYELYGSGGGMVGESSTGWLAG